MKGSGRGLLSEAPQMMLVDRSRAAPPLQSAASLASDGSEASTYPEAIFRQGDRSCLHLRPQQRLPLPPAGKVIVLRDGMLAIDAMPAKGKLQLLDFLMPGDVVS